MGAATLSAQTMVYLEHSETLTFDEKRLPDAQILNGNVCFRHEDALMYCDSAYFYQKTNSLDAFGHIRMLQGDTLAGYGDVLYYDGNAKLARLRRHVRLEHGSTILTTDSLNYDRARNLAYYFTGGTIRDSLNTLKSRWGQYAPPTKQAKFRGKVDLKNPNFHLYADTLHYNTESHIADLVGMTHIEYEKETHIVTTRGWYNTETEQSLLLDRSEVIHTEGKYMTGDSIFYDKKIGFGKVIGNIALADTAQKVTLYGNYGQMYERQDSIGSHGYATDSALLVDWSDDKQYAYMHADTLFSKEKIYKVESEQGITDSVYHLVRAHHKVRMYREDVQSVCDSLIYFDRDSIMSLYSTPVCWSDSNQLSADSIKIYMRNNTVDYIYGKGNALTVKQETDEYFNQMSGKEIMAYIRDQELIRVDVSGNALTIFYPEDEKEKGGYNGMNETQSSYVKMFLEDQKIHHILFTSETTGTMYPLDQVPSGKDKLPGFFWAEAARPLTPKDVFATTNQTERPAEVAVSATDNTAQEEDSEETTLKGNKKKRNRNKK